MKYIGKFCQVSQQFSEVQTMAYACPSRRSYDYGTSSCYIKTS
jgi:hypothetical protein